MLFTEKTTGNNREITAFDAVINNLNNHDYY